MQIRARQAEFAARQWRNAHLKRFREARMEAASEAPESLNPEPPSLEIFRDFAQKITFSLEKRQFPQLRFLLRGVRAETDRFKHPDDIPFFLVRNSGLLEVLVQTIRTIATQVSEGLLADNYGLLAEATHILANLTAGPSEANQQIANPDFVPLCFLVARCCKLPATENVVWASTNLLVDFPELLADSQGSQWFHFVQTLFSEHRHVIGIVQVCARFFQVAFEKREALRITPKEQLELLRLACFILENSGELEALEHALGMVVHMAEASSILQTHFLQLYDPTKLLGLAKAAPELTDKGLLDLLAALTAHGDPQFAHLDNVGFDILLAQTESPTAAHRLLAYKILANLLSFQDFDVIRVCAPLRFVDALVFTVDKDISVQCAVEALRLLQVFCQRAPPADLHALALEIRLVDLLQSKLENPNHNLVEESLCTLLLLCRLPPESPFPPATAQLMDRLCHSDLWTALERLGVSGDHRVRHSTQKLARQIEEIRRGVAWSNSGI